jgi:orotidine-5'-phosphate decarboxylase
VTLNPYLGRDSVQPFLDRADKGVILLCRTSNPGGADFQDLAVHDGVGRSLPLYQHIAATIARDWNAHGNCALVTGATFPEELGAVRVLVGDVPLLVPGVGAQGGDVAAVLAAGALADGTGLIVSSSRAILYADGGPELGEAARGAATALRDAINRHRPRAAPRS